MTSAPLPLDAPRPLTLEAWAADLRRHGLTLLPQSHRVPVEAWIRRGEDEVLHLRARGTAVRLALYDARDLTGLLLRAECDCAEHRAAGAAHRAVLAPGAVPRATAVYDGAREAGWTGHQAGLLGLDEVVGLFERLLSRLPAPPHRPHD